MNRNSGHLGIVFLACSIISSCHKNEDGAECDPTDNYLLNVFLSKVSTISAPDATDSSSLFVNVYKSNAGAASASVKLNDQQISLVNDGVSRCASGSKFAAEVKSIPKTTLPGYFLLGQDNSLQLTGDRSGTLNETFRAPNETRLKPIASGILHRDQDLVLEVMGADDYPFPIPNNPDPSSYFDGIYVNLSYFRADSDTLTYPNLPLDPVSIGGVFQPSAGNKITIPVSQLQKLPLNGTILIQFGRHTQTQLPNHEKGTIDITIRQQQYDYFDLKS